MKVNMLKAKIIEKGLTARSLCAEIKLHPASYYRKINGENEFTRDQIAKIVKVLGLTPEETFSIFFADEVT